MPTTVWLAITSSLVTMVGILAGLGFRDVNRRLTKLERQDAKLFSAILTLLIAKSTDHESIANAIHGLLTNGVEH